MTRSIPLVALGTLLALAPLAVACGSSDASSSNCSASAESALSPALCPKGAVVQGIDVSVYQGTVNWTAVKGAGIDFAFARVSDGTTTLDTEFASNWPKMKAAGVVRGAYQYWHPGQDPKAQANLFLQTVQQAGGMQPGDLPPVMDFEVTDGLPDATIQANMKTWLAAMQAGTGMTPIIYASTSFAAHAGTGFGSYPFWVADWGVSCPAMPAGWSNWAFWQKSDTGSVSGISGAVDLDEFNGTLAQLQGFGGGDAGTPSGDAGTGHDAGADAGSGSSSGGGTGSGGGSGGDAGGAMGAGGSFGAGAGSGAAPCP